MCPPLFTVGTPIVFLWQDITPQADMGATPPILTAATWRAPWQHSRLRRPMFSKLPVTRAGGPGQGAG